MKVALLYVRSGQPFSQMGQNLDPKYSVGQNIDQKAIRGNFFAISTLY
jgi:hypothetical protein